MDYHSLPSLGSFASPPPGGGAGVGGGVDLGCVGVCGVGVE